MEALPSSLLPLTALYNTPQGELPSMASLGNFAENPAADGGGLFALLLSQLDVTQPLATPTTPADEQILSQWSALSGDEALPLAGNPLPPPPLVELSADTATVPALPIDAGTTPIAGVAPAAVLQTAVPVAAEVPLEQLALDDAATRRKPLAPTPTPVVAAPEQSVDAARSEPLMARDATAHAPVAQTLLAESVRPERYETLQRSGLPATPTPTVAPPMQAPAAPLTQPAAPAAAQPSFLLEQPVADPNWGDELGQRLVWMTENGIGRAQLRMNPPELGPVEVRLAVANDDARVSFHVQHGATREALESALPRLREMFASQGLNLSDANVSEQSTGQQQQAGDTSRNAGGQHSESEFEPYELDNALTEAPPADAQSLTQEGRIDAYA